MSTPDARRIVVAQAMRAFAYGFGAVLLGITLDERGFTAVEVGLVLTAVVVGTVLASMAIGRYSDGFGRRRSYISLYVVLAVTGVVFAASSPLWAMVLVALAGGLSTEVVESGPFTSLEQSMLSTELHGEERVRAFGIYNAVAAAAGSLGALAAGGLEPLHRLWPGAPADDRFFLVLLLAAAAAGAVAATLTPRVEAVEYRAPTRERQQKLGESRPIVLRLGGLFALDSLGGGFVVQAFVAYWLAERFGASVGVVGVTFFAVGAVQAGSFLVAPAIARRYGLLHTMVFTHLPSNLLLVAIAFAPTLPIAIALLLARLALSQMDVPTRQAYVMALVEPDERTSAAAHTNTARYVARPAGPLLAGAAASVWLGLPFVVAGAVKGTYDLILWRWFRGVPVPNEPQPTTASADPVNVLEDAT